MLPLFHTGGLNCYTNPVLHAGGTALIMRAFDPGESLRIIGDTTIGLTHFFGVPSIYQFMCQHPSFAETDLSRLQIAGVGGAPMPVPLLKIWQDRGCALVQGYGMTETSPAVMMLDPEDAARKAGSAGKPVLHGDLKIVDADGKPVKPGETGELWVKGPNITPGYWNWPEANKTSFTDGWLHTGDAARVDEDGFYYIVDRTKDMYISGGENVYPAEVEDVLYQMPAIAEAAVIGAPDATWGETGLAVIAVKKGHDVCRSAGDRPLPRAAGAVQMSATDRVHRRPAPQCDRQGAQADAAGEISGAREGAVVSHPISGVATSITAFIGSALRGPTDTPGSVNSFADFERLYGGLWAQSTLGYAVQQFFLNGGSQALIVRVEGDGAGGITDADIIASLPVLEQADLFNLLCIPPLKRSGGDVGKAAWDAAIAYAKSRRAFVIVDPAEHWATAEDVLNTAPASPAS